MPRNFSLSMTDDQMAATTLLLYKSGEDGARYQVNMHPQGGQVGNFSHDEDLSDALTALVGDATITGAQRTAFTAVMQALRYRARLALDLTP